MLTLSENWKFDFSHISGSLWSGGSMCGTSQSWESFRDWNWGYGRTNVWFLNSVASLDVQRSKVGWPFGKIEIPVLMLDQCFAGKCRLKSFTWIVFWKRWIYLWIRYDSFALFQISRQAHPVKVSNYAQDWLPFMGVLVGEFTVMDSKLSFLIVYM